ncbi:MAG: UvrD-helicase domain-containing protein, partial [Candidatus Neomarinimicrobiota bacterium]
MQQQEARSLIPTPRQQQAETHPLAPLMILAGAGTGKTTTLIRRIAHLIQDKSLPPDQILALTFSEKAAAELRQRIDETTGQGRSLTATTFHAFCYQVVLEFKPEFRSRTLMTEGDILFLLREHYRELDDLQSAVFRREPVRAVKAFKGFFDRLRDELIQPAHFPTLLDHSRDQLAQEAAEEWQETYNQLIDHCTVFPRYQQWKAAAGLVDYGDMVYECWRLIESQPDARRALQLRYHTIIVDEFQDNNYALNMIVGRLAEQYHSVTVVGDDDQCIYSFRGASAYNLRDFRQRYHLVPGYGEIVLDENHRSTQPILDLANDVIRHNTGRQSKRLKAGKSRRAGPLPELAVGSPAAQVAYLAETITDMVANGKAALGAIAVLVRTHRQAREVAAGLAESDIPCQYLNVRFFQLPAVRTALAWCTAVAGSPGAHIALYRLITQRFGLPAAAKLQDVLRLINDKGREDISLQASASEEDKSLVALVALISALRRESTELDAGRMLWRILVTSGIYRQHFRTGFLEDQLALTNLTLLLEMARDFAARQPDNCMKRFVQYMEVMQEAEAVEARLPEIDAADAVQVLTVHAAKGKEFPVVFLPFLQSARFPLNYRPPDVVESPPPEWHLWQADPALSGKTAHLEEERRLLYVAITRAKQRLIILTTPKRRSPFISNLPAELVTERTLVEADTQKEQSRSSRLRTELKQRLARELSRGAYQQAHQLVDALRLIDQHDAGLKPDFSTHPLGDELQERLAPDEVQPPSPESEPTTLTLSASAISSYETCPLQYRFAHVDNIPGKEDKPYLTFGRIIHSVLEAFHRPGRQE